MLYHPRFAVDEVGVLVKELLVVGNDLASLVDFEVLLDFLWFTLQVVLLRDFLQPLRHVEIRHFKHSDHPFELLELLLHLLNEGLVADQILLCLYLPELVLVFSKAYEILEHGLESASEPTLL